MNIERINSVREALKLPKLETCRIIPEAWEDDEFMENCECLLLEDAASAAEDFAVALMNPNVGLIEVKECSVTLCSRRWIGKFACTL